MRSPSRNKLTGDAKMLWNALQNDLGGAGVLKQRHAPLLFAMCQQWGFHQDACKRYLTVTNPKERWTVFSEMSGTLKNFQSLAKQFAMGINDELKFLAENVDDSKAKRKAAKTKKVVAAVESRLSKLLNGVSNN